MRGLGTRNKAIMMMSVGLGPCVVQRWKLSEEEQECLAYFNGNGGDQEMKVSM